MNEYIVNPKTQSMFKVFGTTNQLICGARCWLVEANVNQETCTYLGFRIRIQMRSDYPQPVSFQHVVAVQFPEMDFTKEEKDYVSWTGGWMIQIPFKKLDKIRNTVEKNGLIGQMYDMWKTALSGIDWAVTREQFIQETWEDILNDLGEKKEVEVDNSKILKFISPLTTPATPLDEAESL